jgi:hypothetical protein
MGSDSQGGLWRQPSIFPGFLGDGGDDSLDDTARRIGWTLSRRFSCRSASIIGGSAQRGRLDAMIQLGPQVQASQMDLFR